MAKKVTEHTLYQLAEADDEFQQQPDRSCVILGAAQLDYLLALCLKLALKNGEEVAEELIFAGNAPLGAFSARIQSAYGMGIIDSETREELDQIRRIRNLFAHRLDVHSFADSAEAISRCNNLHRGRKLAEEQVEPTRSDLMKPKYLFITTVVDLLDDLHVVAGLRKEKVKRVLMVRGGEAVGVEPDGR